MTIIRTIPNPLLEVIVKRLDIRPALAGVCAGYEETKWRYEQLAEHMMEWLPEFALNAREYNGVQGYSARKALRLAAKNIYTSDKYGRRGEIGEILLHAIIRQEFGSIPLISKIFFKDSPNDTVKGFDAVHVVKNDEGLQLWLGEVKFYKDIKQAIRDVVAEIKLHLTKDFLRAEFAAICNKVDPDHEQVDIVKKLLDSNTSLDTIFSKLCIPVLLTYDSDVVATHTVPDDNYKKAIQEEFEANYDYFSRSGLPAHVEVILIMLPMNSKDLLMEKFDAKLKGLAT